MQPMGRLSMQSWWALFSSFWGGGWRGILNFSLCSQCVLTMLPKGSQVSKCVPLDVPNGTWVLSHMVGRTYELISINHTMSLTKQGKNIYKKKPLQKYIYRDGLSRASNWRAPLPFLLRNTKKTCPSFQKIGLEIGLWVWRPSTKIALHHIFIWTSTICEQ
jgi:hypothetical protein